MVRNVMIVFMLENRRWGVGCAWRKSTSTQTTLAGAGRQNRCVCRWGGSRFPHLHFVVSRYLLVPFSETAMNVVVENLPNCITTLRIELEPEKVTKVWDAVAGD